MEQTGALWRHAQLPQCSVEVVMSSMVSLVSAAVPLAAAAASAALEAKACCRPPPTDTDGQDDARQSTEPVAAV